ncbi:unnamed protein product [Allacma fusca]|uniref:Uncharacterized protein n=1 Tax=Allacma fusca TaxID=39272 RepID=A0A8J2J4R0_9HEXA|nr:unnamed protein product [Allacma fusca]
MHRLEHHAGERLVTKGAPAVLDRAYEIVEARGDTSFIVEYRGCQLSKHRLIRVHSHKLKAYKPPVAWQEEYAKVFRHKVLNEFKNQTSFQELPRQEQYQERRQPRRVRPLSPSTLSFDLGEELPENPIPLLDLLQNQVPAIPKLAPLAAIIQEELNAARSPQRSQPRSTQRSSKEEFIPPRVQPAKLINVGALISDSISSINGHELILPPVEPPNEVEDPQSMTGDVSKKGIKHIYIPAVPPKERDEPYSQLTEYIRDQASIDFQLIPTGAETADLVIKKKPQAIPIPEEFRQPSVTKSGTDSGSKRSLGDQYRSVSGTASGLETGPTKRAKKKEVCKKRKAVLEERDRESRVILDTLAFFAGKEAHWGSMKRNGGVKPSEAEVGLGPTAGPSPMVTVQEAVEPEA